MKKKLRHVLTLGAALALVPAAASADHCHPAAAQAATAEGHDAHGAAATAGAPAQPGRHGVEIRKTVVSGYALAYHLIDMQQMMQSTKMPMTHGAEKMKSHHLMVYAVGPDGKPVTAGKAGYLVVQPDKTEVKAMAMLMEDGFGADVDLKVKGDYRITTKIALQDKALVDEFVYTVK